MSANRILQNFCTCAKLTYNCIEIINIAQRITIIVYPCHQPTHSDPHFTSPETRINTGFLPFVNFYGLPLTFTPAAADTLYRYFTQSGNSPDSFDAIVTGDLATEGSALLCELLSDDNIKLSGNYTDCGLMVYNIEEQDVHAGASGCGCASITMAGYFMNKLESGEINDMLLVTTGALMSTKSLQQGGSIPAVAHLVHIKNI